MCIRDRFDEATAILAGNSLLTLAFEILSDKKLNLKELPKPIDITDAMAVGLCFINNYQII